MRGTLLMLFLLAATPAMGQTPSEVRVAVGAATGAILQADGPRAQGLLEALPVSALDVKDEAFRTCALSRLAPQEPSGATAQDTPFAIKALNVYQTYWRSAANHPDARAEAERALAARLASLLGRPELEDMPQAEGPTLDRIRAEGWHVLGGRTGVLLELMLWRSQDERDVAVALPEGDHQTRLILLDDFESRGWSHWLTCGRSSTGGWAKTEGLYAIVPAYSSLEDEDFHVNFLTHETQHFADYARFPGLQGWELEFRAKLAELAYANVTREKVLRSFVSNQSDNTADAHSHGNQLVLTALRQRLGLGLTDDLLSVPTVTLQAAAVAELKADTQRRAAITAP